MVRFGELSVKNAAGPRSFVPIQMALRRVRTGNLVVLALSRLIKFLRYILDSLVAGNDERSIANIRGIVQETRHLVILNSVSVRGRELLVAHCSRYRIVVKVDTGVLLYILGPDASSSSGYS